MSKYFLLLAVFLLACKPSKVVTFKGGSNKKDLIPAQSNLCGYYTGQTIENQGATGALLPPFCTDIYPMIGFYDSTKVWIGCDSFYVKKALPAFVRSERPLYSWGTGADGFLHTYRIDSVNNWKNIFGRPSSLPPNGTAGGDLTGSYPSPSLANSGVTAGTYGRVVVDSKGRALNGSKRQELYTGTTTGTSGGNPLGSYTITFGTAYSVAPNIQVAIQGDFPSYTAVIASKSTTGFTAKVYTLSSILSLGLVPQYSPVNNVVLDVVVSEK